MTVYLTALCVKFLKSIISFDRNLPVRQDRQAIPAADMEQVLLYLQLFRMLIFSRLKRRLQFWRRHCFQSMLTALWMRVSFYQQMKRI